MTFAAENGLPKHSNCPKSKHPATMMHKELCIISFIKQVECNSSEEPNEKTETKAVHNLL